MKQLNLNGKWKIRWSDGQRGGMPHYIHMPGDAPAADVTGAVKEIGNEYDSRKWIDATVPGEVHADLMRAGIIESPYEAAGVLKCRWVEECFWFYRTVFAAPEAYNAALARLTFKGLDYGAVIYLNGTEIARHENAFYPCAIDVSGVLNPFENVLVVRLESGLYSAADRPIRDYFTATLSADALLHKRNWLRKPQYQAEWDWSPRLLNVGITGAVCLEWGSRMIVSQTAVNASLDADLKAGYVRVRVFTEQWDKSLGDVALCVTLDEKTQSFNFNSIPENGVLEAVLQIENPELWWPAGFGEQTLYTLDIEVLSNGKSLYSEVKNVGFRYVNVNQKSHEECGNYFVFEINGEPIFLKGANFVPNDLLTTAMSPERYEALIELALGANFNFLRIWGGGIYENDVLYELCDRKGILLWQEFIAACAVIPIKDEALLESIKQEAVYNIRRLSAHASLIAWCGNNEIDWITKDFEGMHTREDFPLYHEILPSLLKAEAPETYYQPTSPFSAKHEDHNNDTTGDQHPWSVGFENKDSRLYEDMVCRFPNEGGILGPSSLPTMKSCLRAGDGIHSFSWQVHDNMMENYQPGSSPDEDLRFWTGMEVSDLSLEEYVYAGGITQAEGLKRYIDNFRRRKFSSSCAVFWMYNDCWPTTRSWTVVDYYLRRTPSYHTVRRAFLPVAPVIAKEGKVYRIYGVNDTLTERETVLRYGVFQTDGTYIMDHAVNVLLPANNSLLLAEILAENVEQAGGNCVAIVFARLDDSEGNLIARTRYTDARFCDIKLPEEHIRTQRCDNGWLFTSDVFVMNICVDLDGEGAVSDNLFDLYPGQPHFVKFGSADMKSPILFTLNGFLRAFELGETVIEFDESVSETQAI